MIKVKIKNKSKNELPEYKTPGSAGVDLRADIQRKLVVLPGARLVVPTGLFMEIPEGYEGQIRSRSGLAAKNGIIVLNSPGTIDCDYREEILVILFNSSKENFIIEAGDRIAQMVFAKYEKIEFEEIEELSSTERTDGLGSTGIK